jgi:sporulation protein YlmC with PRC-barrel domain
MANATRSALYRLADSDLRLADPAEDVRGRQVLDAGGKEIGTVNDLLIDPQEQKVRYLRVGAGGFLGIGETEFLIPVDIVTRVTDEAVHVDRPGEQVAGAPRYDPELTDERYLNGLSRYYGHRPYWHDAYRYPGFPYYA